jgi:hypothetical protein
MIAPLLKKSIRSEKSNKSTRKKTVKKGKLEQSILKKLVKKRKTKGCTPNWRIKDSNFINTTNENILEAGTVNFSSGWYGQGHVVCLNSFS